MLRWINVLACFCQRSCHLWFSPRHVCRVQQHWGQRKDRILRLTHQLKEIFLDISSAGPHHSALWPTLILQLITTLQPHKQTDVFHSPCIDMKSQVNTGLEVSMFAHRSLIRSFHGPFPILMLFWGFHRHETLTSLLKYK